MIYDPLPFPISFYLVVIWLTFLAVSDIYMAHKVAENLIKTKTITNNMEV